MYVYQGITRLTLINPCKSPAPTLPYFCAFIHSPQAPRASLAPFLLVLGSERNRGHLIWNRSSPPPSQTIRVSCLFLALGHGEWPPTPCKTNTQNRRQELPPSPHLTADCAGHRDPTWMVRTPPSPAPAPSQPAASPSWFYPLVYPTGRISFESPYSLFVCFCFVAVLVFVLLWEKTYLLEFHLFNGLGLFSGGKKANKQKEKRNGKFRYEWCIGICCCYTWCGSFVGRILCDRQSIHFVK